MISISPFRSLLMSAVTIIATTAPVAGQQKHAAPALAQAVAENLPGGASSIQETYGAWTVSCRLAEGRKACTFSQVRGSQETGQRSFAIELRPPADGKTDGVLVLPFGLSLSDGVKLALDEKPLGQSVPFSTCVPDGCLAPVSFPTVATDAIKTAKVLTITATPASGTEALTFSIALDGFTSAFARIAELAK